MWQQRQVVQALREPQQQMQVNRPQRIQIESATPQPYEAPKGNDGMKNLTDRLGQMGGKMFADSGGFSSLFGTGGAGIGNAAEQYGPEVAKMGGNVSSTGWGSDASGGFMDMFGLGGDGGSSLGGDAGYLGTLMKGSQAIGNLLGEGDNGFFSRMGNSKGDLGMGLWGDLGKAVIKPFKGLF